MFRRLLISVALEIVIVAATANGQGADPFSARPANIYAGSPTQPLAVSQNESREATVTRFLRQRGIDVSEQSLSASAEAVLAQNGITVIRLEQSVAGMTIYGVYAKAAFTDNGDLVQLIENLIPRFNGAIASPGINESEALNAAMEQHHPGVTERPALRQFAGQSAVFQRTPFFHSEPTVTRVAVPGPNGSLRPGMLVETWSERQNLLYHTLVGPQGEILESELRTANDSFNVFLEDPSKGGQVPVIVNYGEESPIGWLAGVQSTINIAGNNVNAYLDVDANDLPDSGGIAVGDGNFLTAANLAVAPSTDGNREVAVQNLFYLNNRVHDILYLYGFNESAGNFQEDNLGRGGAESDSVNAEAQDGGGTDNANFATPSDGSNPRMQMYLWNPAGADHEVYVSAERIYPAKGAEFGPALSTGGLAGIVVLVDDGRGVRSDGCQRIRNNKVSGRIALMDRGGCDFTVKVENAQAAGAIAAIIANNVGDSIFTMGGSSTSINIPSVFVGQSAGSAMKSLVPLATVRKLANPPLQRDASLDSDIVFHEYGHGLTWRMIGNMSGAIAGAIGEGASDGVALLINGNDVVGEYSVNDPKGIRRDPYTNYPRTYADFTGAEVHDDGEIYAAIVWRLKENFEAEGAIADPVGTLFGYYVDGMNFTPSKPSFEDMRDGMLQSATNAGAGHECLIWRAFAKYGVGVGAKAAVKGRKLTITESFSVPSGCPQP